MKNVIFMPLAIVLLITACQQNETTKDEFTGNEVVYALQAGSEYNINGTVTFKERVDGKAFIVVTLNGTEGNVEHPVHVHLGDITDIGADVYALLNPVSGKTGKSETILTQIADESAITYNDLTNLDACIKIHLAASGPDRDIVLAAGNIGSNALKDSSFGRLGIGNCKSE